MYDDAYTRNEDGELAVRTVNVTEGSNSSSYDDVFTRDTEGKLALRVTGGGDNHNKGYFATLADLQEAYPTGEAGDYAIVGATDTVWLWDEDTSAWKDSDTKGQVTSVNGQTGAVTVSEVPSMEGYSGRVLGTDGTVAGWIVPEQIQRSTMPQADENEVGNIYQFTGTTDANYTNGYFYKCVSDGQDPATYSWTRVNVQPAGATYTAGNGISIDANNEISVTDPVLVNTATATSALTILGTANTTKANAINIGSSSVVAGSSDIAIGNKAKTYSDGVQIAIGYEAEVKNNSGIAIGAEAKSLVTNGVSTAIGAHAQVLATGKCGLALGNYSQVSAPYAIEINASDFTYTNSEEGTLCVGLRKGSSGANYKLMNSDGTVPTARLTKVNTTATLAVADWSSSTQTVTVSGVKADSVVFVSPAPASASDYASAGILCTAQAADSLTFTCTTTPTNAITVNVICF